MPCSACPLSARGANQLCASETHPSDAHSVLCPRSRQETRTEDVRCAQIRTQPTAGGQRQRSSVSAAERRIQVPDRVADSPPTNNYVPSPNPVGCLFDRIRPLSALAAAAPAPRRFGKSPGAAGGWRPPPPGGGSPSAAAARRSWRARSISHRLLAPFGPPPSAPGGGSRRPTTAAVAFGRRRAAGVVTRLVGPPWGLWGRVLCTFGGLLLTR